MLNECDTRFLDDDPSFSDELGGAHGRPAEALASVISASSTGKLIGLVGMWGSGKSTVIRLLDKTLERYAGHGSVDVVILNFKAWQHEGDPLRRTFLESLIVRLQQQGWLPKESFDKERETLARRIEETRIESQPVVNGGGLDRRCLAVDGAVW